MQPSDRSCADRPKSSEMMRPGNMRSSPVLASTASAGGAANGIASGAAAAIPTPHPSSPKSLQQQRFDMIAAKAATAPTTPAAPRPSTNAPVTTIAQLEKFPSLDEILGCPGRMIIFCRFCKSALNEENALFYLAVSRYKMLPEGSAVQLSTANYLYHRYIREGAPHEVSTPGPVLAQIIAELKSGQISVATFDRAQKLACASLDMALLSRFYASPFATFLELEGFLLHPIKHAHVLRFCRDRYCEELALFYHDAEHYRKLVTIKRGNTKQQSLNPQTYKSAVFINSKSPEAGGAAGAATAAATAAAASPVRGSVAVSAPNGANGVSDSTAALFAAPPPPADATVANTLLYNLPSEQLAHDPIHDFHETIYESVSDECADSADEQAIMIYEKYIKKKAEYELPAAVSAPPQPAPAPVTTPGQTPAAAAAAAAALVASKEPPVAVLTDTLRAQIRYHINKDLYTVELFAPLQQAVLHALRINAFAEFKRSPEYKRANDDDAEQLALYKPHQITRPSLPSNYVNARPSLQLTPVATTATAAAATATPAAATATAAAPTVVPAPATPVKAPAVQPVASPLPNGNPPPLPALPSLPPLPALLPVPTPAATASTPTAAAAAAASVASPLKSPAPAAGATASKPPLTPTLQTSGSSRSLLVRRLDVKANTAATILLASGGSVPADSTPPTASPVPSTPTGSGSGGNAPPALGRASSLTSPTIRGSSGTPVAGASAPINVPGHVSSDLLALTSPSLRRRHSISNGDFDILSKLSSPLVPAGTSAGSEPSPINRLPPTSPLVAGGSPSAAASAAASSDPSPLFTPSAPVQAGGAGSKLFSRRRLLGAPSAATNIPSTLQYNSAGVYLPSLLSPLPDDSPVAPPANPPVFSFPPSATAASANASAGQVPSPLLIPETPTGAGAAGAAANLSPLGKFSTRHSLSISTKDDPALSSTAANRLGSAGADGSYVADHFLAGSTPRHLPSFLSHGSSSANGEPLTPGTPQTPNILSSAQSPSFGSFNLSTLSSPPQLTNRATSDTTNPAAPGSIPFPALPASGASAAPLALGSGEEVYDEQYFNDFSDARTRKMSGSANRLRKGDPDQLQTPTGAGTTTGTAAPATAATTGSSATKQRLAAALAIEQQNAKLEAAANAAVAAAAAAAAAATAPPAIDTKSNFPPHSINPLGAVPEQAAMNFAASVHSPISRPMQPPTPHRTRSSRAPSAVAANTATSFVSAPSSELQPSKDADETEQDAEFLLLIHGNGLDIFTRLHASSYAILDPATGKVVGHRCYAFDDLLLWQRRQRMRFLKTSNACFLASLHRRTKAEIREDLMLDAHHMQQLHREKVMDSILTPATPATATVSLPVLAPVPTASAAPIVASPSPPTVLRVTPPPADQKDVKTPLMRGDSSPALGVNAAPGGPAFAATRPAPLTHAASTSALLSPPAATAASAGVIRTVAQTAQQAAIAQAQALAARRAHATALSFSRRVRFSFDSRFDDRVHVYGSKLNKVSQHSQRLTLFQTAINSSKVVLPKPVVEQLSMTERVLIEQRTKVQAALRQSQIPGGGGPALVTAVTAKPLIQVPVELLTAFSTPAPGSTVNAADVKTPIPIASASAATAAAGTGPKSVLRGRLRASDLLARQLEATRQAMGVELYRLMCEGSLIEKYGVAGTPSPRWFTVTSASDGGAEIRWTKVDKNKKPKKSSGLFGALNKPKTKPLADVMRIRYGSRFSRRFARYNESGKPPWLCLTLVFPDRTLDLCCLDEKTVDVWFLGLQSVTPLSQCYLSRGALHWARAKMKVRFRASTSGVNEQSIWHAMLARARRDTIKSVRGRAIRQALAAKALAKQNSVPWTPPNFLPFTKVPSPLPSPLPTPQPTPTQTPRQLGGSPPTPNRNLNPTPPIGSGNLLTVPGAAPHPSPSPSSTPPPPAVSATTTTAPATAAAAAKPPTPPTTAAVTASTASATVAAAAASAAAVKK